MAYRNLELLTLQSHDKSGNFLWQGVNGCQYTSACHSEGTPVFYTRSQDMAGILSKCDSEYFLHCTACQSGPSHYGTEFETGFLDSMKKGYNSAKEWNKQRTYSFETEMKTIGNACANIIKNGTESHKTTANAIIASMPDNCKHFAKVPE
jgi:hypothetical protein